jgi:4-amino-4-deoxy-L-arabinose transferase-like glycosyltransferase
VAFESQYRSGLLPSLISVCAFALSGWLTYRISYRLTGSMAAGVFAAAVLLANPNLEYLQSCPLTEPVYMALLLLAVDRLIVWRESDHSTLPWLAAVWTALGALCRYEGWYFLAGVFLLFFYDFCTKYVPRRRVVQAGALFLTAFGVPVAAHFGYIAVQLKDNFFSRVAEGNPAPYLTYKRPVLSILYHLAELSQMAAILPLLLAAAGVLLFVLQRKELKFRAPLMLLWLPSLINVSALYWGLVYRLRYSVLLVPAIAIFGSLLLTSDKAKRRALVFLAITVMLLPCFSWYASRVAQSEMLAPGPGALMLPVAGLILFMGARVRAWDNWALLVLCVLGMQFPPLAREDHPMIDETLEHQFIEPERQEVLQYLRQNYDGRRILIDMGKLAPLVYDSELPVKGFVYNEGGKELWNRAFRKPEREVGWLCVQKGDALWGQLQVDPHWADEYALAVKTEYFSLYRLKH